MKVYNAIRDLNYPFIRVIHFISAVILFDSFSLFERAAGQFDMDLRQFYFGKKTSYNERAMEDKTFGFSEVSKLQLKIEI